MTIIVAAGSGNWQFVAVHVQVCSAYLRPKRIGSLCLSRVAYRSQQDTGFRPGMLRSLIVVHLYRKISELRF